MFKGIKNLILIVAALFAFGCATTGLDTIGVKALPDGSTVQYVAAQSGDAWGIDGKVFDRYQTKSVFNEHTRKYEPVSVLVAKDAGFTNGIGKQTVENTVPALVGGTVQAGGMVWAAKVLRPDQTNVNAGNNSGNLSQGQLATGGQVIGSGNSLNNISNRVNNRNNNSNTINNDNRNTNANLNNNTNHNTATGGTGGVATAVNNNSNTNTATGGSVNTGGGSIDGGGNITAGNNANINTGAISNTGAGTVNQGQH